MLRISQPEFNDLRAHGEQAYPQESCGVLLGHREAGDCVVTAVVRCANARLDSPQSRYHIDPAELVRVQRQARERGLEIIGFYHSHPDHPARWSPTDLEEAHWPGCSYVINSVERGRAAATNSFLLCDGENDKHFTEEELVVTEPE